MCCFFTTLVFLGPRVGLGIWWLLRPIRFAIAFNSWILTILGIIFLPWTTLTYAIVFKPAVGLVGIDWIFLGFAFLVDIASYSGGAYGNGDRFRRNL